MMAMARALAALLITSLGAALAQTPLKFEVASVRQNKSGDNSATWNMGDSGTFRGSNIPLDFLVMTAFKLKEAQLRNMPGWSESERYDIEAKVTGKPSQEEIFGMLQNLLVDRFNLKY